MNFGIRILAMAMFIAACALAACGGGGGGSGTAYTVSYAGNGSTGGTAPSDATAYAQSQSVGVKGNSSSLVKAGYAFAGWNTEADGSGASMLPGSSFAMGAADVVLYAQWIQNTPKRIMFIHHSSGGNWLADGNGDLGDALNTRNYYVTESDYGWDAEPGDNLGDSTDTIHWPLWFTDTKMPYVYQNSSHSAYANAIADPGGENEIIMFKASFTNSEVDMDIACIDDEKAIYNSLKAYFTAHPDKLFVLVTPPGRAVVTSPERTKELCDWLVDTDTGWLSDYAEKNVLVFDLYAVLSELDSHHRMNNGVVERVYGAAYDGESPYHDGDDHPNSTGSRKATEEFIGLLDFYYYCVFKQ